MPVVSEKRIVFVCTGNICRSPMAESMLRARLGGASEWVVASAGLSACRGAPASMAAVSVMGAEGIDLSSHRSQPLDRAAVDAATVIVVMTAAHRDQIRMLYPDATGKVFLLGSFGRRNGDVSDPIGSSADAYFRTRDTIDEALPELIAFLETLDIQ